jgi:hypothetical protein
LTLIERGYNTMADFKRENIKLASLLLAAGFNYFLKDCFDGTQVILYDDCWQRVADSICHSGSYGHEDGLLEIFGLGVKNKYYDVEGWLTADEVFNRWKNAMAGKGE